MQLLMDVGYRVAQGSVYPEWKPGTEFKARREESLKTPKVRAHFMVDFINSTSPPPPQPSPTNGGGSQI